MNEKLARARLALERMPDLHFELMDLFASVNSICILYKSIQCFSNGSAKDC